MAAPWDKVKAMAAFATAETMASNTAGSNLHDLTGLLLEMITIATELAAQATMTVSDNAASQGKYRIPGRHCVVVGTPYIVKGE